MARATGRINAVTGFKVERLDRATLETYAKQLGILAPDATDEQLGVQLYVSYLKGVGGDSRKLAECDICLGRSPESISACPYCDETEAPPAPATKKDPPASAGGKTSTPKETHPMTTTKDGTKKDGTTMTALAKTEKDLNRQVTEVVELKTAVAKDYWKLGCKIAEIHDGQTWKLRNAPDGKPRWRTFEAFCNEELGLSSVHCVKLMDVAKTFSAGDVAKFGTGKLGLLLQAPEAERPAIKAKIEGGASTGVVCEAVREANKGKTTTRGRDGKQHPIVREGQTTKSGKPAKKPGRPAKAETKPASRKTITIANIEGNEQVPLFTKASVLAATGDRKAWVRAKKISDVPTGTREMDNDVMQVFTVIEGPDGFLRIKVETHRV
jgi:hypothetical protein